MRFNHNFNTLVAAAALALCAPMAQAAFTVDGLTYEVNNEAARTVTLTEGASSRTNIMVPETVTNNGVTYTVNTIGTNAFYQKEVVATLDLPTTVVRLEQFAFCELTASLVRIRGNLQSMDFGAFYGNKVQSITCNYSDNFSHIMGVLTNKEKTMILAFPGRGSSVSNTAYEIPESITTIAPYAFAEAPNLTTITIPATVTEIGYAAFQECPSARTIRILGSNTTVGDRAFMGCEAVTSLSLPVGMKTVGHSAFFDLASLTTLTLPEGMEDTGIMAFANSGLKTINFPSTLRTIGERAFMSCPDLQQVSLPESLDSINYSAFYGCDLRSVDLKNTKYLGELVFTNNYNLSQVTTGERLEVIGNAPFYGCRSLTEVPLPASLRVMTGGTFYLCSGLNTLTIPAGVEEIGYNIAVGTTSLDAIAVDPANTHFAAQDGWLYTADLKTLKAIPGSVTGTLTVPDGVTTVGEQAARRLAITELVTGPSLRTIEGSAFMQCSALTTVTLGAHVAELGGNAFYGANAITAVTSLNRTPPAGGVFADEVYEAATLSVPRGSKDAYQADENWGRFVNIEEIDVDNPAVPGDLNGDGTVDVEDVNLIINSILAGEPSEDYDITGDGTVDVEDVNALINVILG